MKVLSKAILITGTLLLLSAVGACAVGPGTPLVDALKTGGPKSSDVPVPKGYGAYVNPGESSGLINPTERKATEAYLESLASE